jgi:hypothetical protein
VFDPVESHDCRRKNTLLRICEKVYTLDLCSRPTAKGKKFDPRSQRAASLLSIQNMGKYEELKELANVRAVLP